MFPILHTLAILVCDLFKSRRRLEAENLFLRHQLNVILRQSPTRFRMRDIDRLLLTWMVRLWANSLGMVQRWSSPKRWGVGIRQASERCGAESRRTRAGRPKIGRDLRDLMERMSQEKPLWGGLRLQRRGRIIAI